MTPPTTTAEQIARMRAQLEELRRRPIFCVCNDLIDCAERLDQLLREAEPDALDLISEQPK